MRLGIALLCLILQGPAPGNGKRESSPPKSQTDQQQQQPAPAASTTPTAVPTAAKNRPYSAANGSDGKSASDWWMIGLTGGLLLVAAFQVGLFWQQLGIMNDSLVDTQAAAAAALVGAKAAKASVDAAMRIERAYLFFDFLGSNDLNGTQPYLTPALTRQIVLTNYGKTPAIFQNLSTWFGYSLGRPYREGEELKFEGKTGIPVSSGESIRRTSVRLSATSEEIKTASRGLGGIYITGQIDYDDVFGDHHTTVFCWQYSPSQFHLVNDPKLNYHT
jgi:hypothetical protein